MEEAVVLVDMMVVVDMVINKLFQLMVLVEAEAAVESALVTLDLVAVVE